MSYRLRSRLASSEEDRIFQRYLADADAALKKAGEVCQGIIRQGRDDRVASHRAQDALQTVNQAIRAINTLGHLCPIQDGEDLDSIRRKAHSDQLREEIRQRHEQEIHAKREAGRLARRHQENN